MIDPKKEDIFYETFLSKKLNILFWDDGAEDKYKTLFTEIERGFKRYGWNIRILTDKKEAIDLALKEKFDAVVLDLLKNKKPVGLEMLKELRQKRPFLPIIIFTIAPEMKYIQSAMRGDVSYYLTKPIQSYHDVIRAIEVGIEREKAKDCLVQDRYFTSIGKLAASVAHFIKNSLWNIGSRAQILLEKTDKKGESYKLLETIKRRTDDADKVVSSLLNFAKGRNKITEKEEINIGEKIKSILQLLSYEIEYHNISVKENIKSDNLRIKGNEFNLQEAFINIIKNAIEAMPDGGELSVNVSAEANVIEIKISDTGVGMSKETQENLFMPLYTTKENSFGFGLSETKMILDDHDGTISFESELEKGTTVTMTLPRVIK